MKRTLFLFILIVFIVFIVSIVGCDNQTPTKELYKLQEQCGKQSEEWFKDREGMKSYNNHYNKKLNKCFIFVVGSFSDQDGVIHYTGEGLFDVNENKRYGQYTGDEKNTKMIDCYILEKQCKSYEEWKSRVKPYMEE
jgi:hypothetical protein